MHERVLGQRHLAVLYGRRDVRKKLAAFLDGVVRPVGQIKTIASAMYVSFDKPGERGYVAVPRPSRVVGVTVGARAFENAFDFQRND
jgi:hypothetical protein